MAEPAAAAVAEPGEALRTLLVEDDETAAGLLARALRRHGFEVQAAGSVQQALSLSSHWCPQAAVVDLRLQQESGLDLIPVLVRQRPGIRILMLTGYASIATAVQAIKLGASDYLPKPAPIAEIVAALRGRSPDGGTAAQREGINRPSVRRFEWEYIQQVLAEHGGNISETARALRMQRRTLQRKLAKRPARS